VNPEYSSIEEVIQALRDGKPVIITDDEDRENEGDAIIAAQFATTEWVAWMIRYTSGFLCAPMSSERANQLDLPLMWVRNQDPHHTAYTVSVDAANRTSTGISAAERANTARVLADPYATPQSLIRPGHVLPLRAKPGGVQERAGHTEAAVDLLELANLEPVGLMAELVNDDGTMMKSGELFALAKRFELPMSTISHLRDHLEKRSPERKYSQNPGEAFGSLKCECGPQLDAALDAIAKDPNGGVVIYLRGQEGRGIGLLNKLKAYSLQEQGLDTVDANLALGLPSEAREYGAAVAILKDLGIESVRLLSNNPAKRRFLEDAGIPVTDYVPLIVGLAEQNKGYLEAKRARMGHIIPANLK